MNPSVLHGLHAGGSKAVQGQSCEAEGTGADIGDLRMFGAPILKSVRALVSFGLGRLSANFTPDAAHYLGCGICS